MGWEIANNYESRTAGSTGSFTTTTGFVFKIRVNGTPGSTTATNTAPTAADNTVRTARNTAYTFTAGDFGFADTDAGDALASVKIESLPAVGTLALDGTAVTLNRVVTRTQIDDGDLTFTPAAGASGAGYASFDFKVNDGTDDSASAYTMTIDVTATTTANTAPGAPTGLTATANGPSRIDLAWTAPASIGSSAITGYKIEVSPDGSSWSDLVADTRSTATTYADMGLNAATTRHYRVSAINAAGTSDPSGSDEATTEAVPAQTAVLVSNVGQPGDDGFGLDTNDHAQSFTTGDDATYTLTSIELTLQTAASSTDTPAVKLYSRSADGTEVTTLTGPAMLDAGTIKNYAFRPSSTVTLLTSTTYWVVAEGDAYWVSTTSTSEDETPAMGWEIANNYESRTAGSTGSFTTTTGFAFKIRVNGTTGATSAAATATTTSSAAATATTTSSAAATATTTSAAAATATTAGRHDCGCAAVLAGCARQCAGEADMGSTTQRRRLGDHRLRLPVQRKRRRLHCL